MASMEVAAQTDAVRTVTVNGHPKGSGRQVAIAFRPEKREGECVKDHLRLQLEALQALRKEMTT